MKKKIFALITAIAIISMLCISLVACGEKGDDDNNAPAPTPSYLTKYVDYSTLDFQQITYEQIESTFDSATLEGFLTANFAGQFAYGKAEQTTVLDLTTSIRGSSAGVFVSGSLGDDKFAMDSYEDYLLLMHKSGDTKTHVKIDQTALVIGYFKSIYGLTAEEVAQKQQAYEDKIAQDNVTDDTDVIDGGELISTILKSFITSNTVQLFSTTDGEGYTHIKISTSGEKIWTKIGEYLAIMQIDSSVIDMIKSFYNIGDLDVYITIKDGFVLGGKIETSISMPIFITQSILSDIVTTNENYSSQIANLLYPYIDTKPIALPSKVWNWVNGLSDKYGWKDAEGFDDYCEAKFTLDGTVTFRAVGAELSGTIQPAQCKTATFESLFGEPLNISDLIGQEE